MRTVLVIFHSRGGTSRRAARLLAAQQAWPTGEVVEERPRSGIGGTLACVIDSLLRRHPPVRYVGPDPGDFDLVVLVSPIWAWRLSGPMRSFASAHGRRLRSYAVLSTMGAGGAANAEAELRRLTGRSPVLCAAVLARHVEDGSCATTLEAFGDTLAGERFGAQPPPALSAQVP